MQEINTERLLLRPIRIDDANAIFRYRSDAESNKYQGWIPENIEDVVEFIEKIPAEINVYNSWYQLGIIEKISKELIGDIGIHFVDSESMQVEIGCTLNKSFQGMGFASEALRMLISYLFKDLKKHRILASIDPENANSIKLLERLGFRKEAHFKESLLINGIWHDDIIYALLSHEWK